MLRGKECRNTNATTAAIRTTRDSGFRKRIWLRLWQLLQCLDLHAAEGAEVDSAVVLEEDSVEAARGEAAHRALGRVILF